MIASELLRDLMDNPLTENEMGLKRAAEAINDPDAVVAESGAIVIVKRSQPTKVIQPPPRATWD
jgi:hypothetical protein